MTTEIPLRQNDDACHRQLETCVLGLDLNSCVTLGIQLFYSLCNYLVTSTIIY